MPRSLPTFDAIVVGLGAAGSATAYQLAKAGASVLGIDRHHPPHDRGSSHGESRITRLAVGEGAHLVPLVKRSHELWREIEGETGTTILTQTGMLLVGADRAAVLHGSDDFLASTIAAAHEHDVEHEVLTAREAGERFPQFAFSGTERGAYYEPGAGFLRPEQAIASQLELARRHGAQLRLGERVTAVGRGRVTTEGGEYAARHVVLSVGPWVGEFVPGRFEVHRQVVYRFETTTPDLHRDMPIFIWELGDRRDDFVYGFPTIDGLEGIKLSSEEYTAATTPEACERTVTDAEARRFHERYVRGRLPGIGERCVKATTCLYTMAPDFEFAVEDHDGVLLVSACSGHGFKHSAALGERIARRLGGDGGPG